MISHNGVYSSSGNAKKIKTDADFRIGLVVLFIFLFSFLIGVKLFFIMIVQHNFYLALAEGSQEVYTKLFPKRGEIYIQDSRSKEEYPFAINKDFFLIFADTRKIESEEQAKKMAEKFSEVFDYDEEKKEKIFQVLAKRNDPYEPIEQKAEEEAVGAIKEMNFPGIYFARRPYRFYPEENLASSVIGFLGKDENGNNVGRYGVEGYWEKELAGTGGFFEGLTSAGGRWIPVADRLFEPSEDGSDILLTIDRTLQFKACEILEKARKEYEAQSASLIITDPKTGAIRVMCSSPDFNPNKYNEVESAENYNNSSVFVSYEPGSIFKPLVMASAINEGVLTPQTSFYDSGEVEANCLKPIKNANGKIYEQQNMIGVLENSINTGMVFVARKLGKHKLVKYIEDFGFGVKTGLELETESAGNIDMLYRSSKDEIDCYGATASFGQGIAATPLQMITAFSAIANGGKLLKPFIVEEIRHSDGRVEKTKVKEIRQVLNSKASFLVAGMLVSVIDNGQAKNAGVSGYHLAGKTGTAQISGVGGYSAETNQSFIGFGPIEDPVFVMIVKFEKPKRDWADSTASPVFKEVAEFVLRYYQVAPSS